MSDIRKFRESQRSGHRRASDLSVIHGFLDDDMPPATSFLDGGVTRQISVVEWQQETPHANQVALGDWNSQTNTPAIVSSVGTAGHYYRVNESNDPTTLSVDIDNLVTSITVADASKLPSAVPFDITIDSEDLSVTAKVGNVLTVIRGQNGTTAVAHYTPARVYFSLNGAGPFRHGQLVQFNGTAWSIVSAKWYETGEKALVVNRDTSRESFIDHRVSAAWSGEFLVYDSSCGPER